MRQSKQQNASLECLRRPGTQHCLRTFCARVLTRLLLRSLSVDLDIGSSGGGANTKASLNFV